MGFLDKFFKEKKTETEKIMDKRSQIKEAMAEKFKKDGFSKMEINEILDIVTIAESDIQVLKDSLIGTNINTNDPTPIMAKVMGEIRQRQLQMADEIKSKVMEIKQRKEAYKKEL